MFTRTTLCSWNSLPAFDPSASWGAVAGHRAAPGGLEADLHQCVFQGHWLDINLWYLFLIVEKIGAPGGNPQRHWRGKWLKATHEMALTSWKLNPGPPRCEAVALNTMIYHRAAVVNLGCRLARTATLCPSPPSFVSSFSISHLTLTTPFYFEIPSNIFRFKYLPWLISTRIWLFGGGCVSSCGCLLCFPAHINWSKYKTVQ